MKPVSFPQSRKTHWYFIFGVLSPTKIVAKGGGGHGHSSSGKSQDSTSSSKSSGSSKGSSGFGGGSSSSSYQPPIIIHTSHTTCVDQNTGQPVPCPHKLSTGAIVGIVIGSIVGSFLLILLIWFIVSRFRQRKLHVRTLPTTRQKTYQPLEGHVYPEGAAHESIADRKNVAYPPSYAPSISDSSTIVGQEEEEKKGMGMPEPHDGKGGYLEV
ncbi:hypothetical protein GYMLUDRAFT_34972 [Collybiopsis luxurians FD-317 M1]|nr:hypothetical protein GYMLUDRAFT_34972 [Collybiopsis luxurians FD-317 M1]